MSWASRTLEQRLLEALNANAKFAAAGLRAEAGEPHGIVLFRAEHGRGVWRHDGRRFLFTPAASRAAALEAMTVEEALTLTLDRLV